MTSNPTIYAASSHSIRHVIQSAKMAPKGQQEKQGRSRTRLGRFADAKSQHLIVTKCGNQRNEFQIEAAD